jgi:hypothetical protein
VCLWCLPGLVFAVRVSRCGWERCCDHHHHFYHYYYIVIIGIHRVRHQYLHACLPPPLSGCLTQCQINSI